MKFTIHVPTEQFGYVSAELEAEDPKRAYEAYNAIASEFKPKPINSLSEKEFNQILDQYLTQKTIPNGYEAYEKMSPQQQGIIQAIKRSFARMKR